MKDSNVLNNLHFRPESKHKIQTFPNKCQKFISENKMLGSYQLSFSSVFTSLRHRQRITGRSSSALRRRGRGAHRLRDGGHRGNGCCRLHLTDVSDEAETESHRRPQRTDDPLHLQTDRERKWLRSQVKTHWRFHLCTGKSSHCIWSSLSGQWHHHSLQAEKVLFWCESSFEICEFSSMVTSRSESRCVNVTWSLTLSPVNMYLMW